MSGKGKITTRCPVCEARYHVPAGSIGHKARCAKCQSTFQVAEIKLVTEPRVPTEDDILRWLNEGLDDEFIAARPRIVGADGRELDGPDSPRVLQKDNRAEPAPASGEHRPTSHPRLAEPARPAVGASGYLRKTG